MSLDNICYKKNYLTAVICNLNYSHISNLDSNVVKDFYEQIKDNYEEPIEVKAIEYKLILEGLKKTDTIEPQTIYKFESNDNKHIVKLSKNSLVIENKSYTNFAEFQQIIMHLVDDLFLTVQPSTLNGLELRYINQIAFAKGDPLNWKEYISNQLIQNIEKFFQKTKNLARSMTQAVLNYDDFFMTFNYGIFNGEFPSKITRKEFILDYNCYVKNFEKDEILQYLAKFNSEIKILFEKSIKQKLREKMGVINDQQ